MEEMSILEFLAFEDVPKEVKLALKNIYFNVQGGKNAVIVHSPESETFMCKYMEREKMSILTKLHHKFYKTIEMSKVDGHIIREKDFVESTNLAPEDPKVEITSIKSRK